LEVGNELELGALLSQALEQNIPAVAFHEPDLEGQATAVALGPTAATLVRRLPLALKDGCT